MVGQCLIVVSIGVGRVDVQGMGEECHYLGCPLRVEELESIIIEDLGTVGTGVVTMQKHVSLLQEDGDVVQGAEGEGGEHHQPAQVEGWGGGEGEKNHG